MNPLFLTALTLMQGPLPTLPLPAPLPGPVVAYTPFVSQRPLTVKEFAAGFVAVPGQHKVCLIHPRKGCPVEVCFNLPPCPLLCVKTGWRTLTFDYGSKQVVIYFRLCGKVDVKYI